MLPIGLPPIRTILCLAAHADDIEIGCGGTLLALLSRQPEIQARWVVLSADRQRRQEAEAGAARFLQRAGSSTITVEDFRDSYFPSQYEQLKDFFHDLQRQVAPDLVFTPRRNDAHQDHRLVAELAWCAFRDHVILEYEIPKYEGDLGQPNVFFTLERDICQEKIERIIQTYRTQAAKRWFREDTFWSLLRLRGIECQSPTGYAEGFYVRKLAFDAQRAPVPDALA